MKDTAIAPEFAALLRSVWRELSDPQATWQIAAIVIAVAVAFVLDRRARRREIAAQYHAVKVGVGGVKRLVFPLTAVLLLVVARASFRAFHTDQYNILNLAIALLGAMAIIRLAVYLLRHVFGASRILVSFERWIALAVWVGFALYVTGILPLMVDLLDDIAVPLGKSRISLWTMLQGAFWVLLTLLLALWVASGVEQRIMRTDALNMSARIALSRIVQSLLVLVAILISLPAVGIDLTMLSVLGGAIGVGLGFGFQKIAANYVSGFIVLLDGSIRLGDLITADNFHGQVKEMSTRYTVVRSLDGREAIIPNETLITSTVINHSFTNREARSAVQLQVAYSADVERAIALLKEIAQKHPRVHAQPPANAFVTGFADSGVNLEVGFWISDPEQGTLGVRSDVSREILAAFRREGIEIPFPQREVRILGAAAAPAGPGTAVP
jgi:small-conductance mechanosensitive channel